jgi:Rho termination factor, N-terminal domain
MAVARELDVRGRSRLTKPELVRAIQKENDRRTREARGERQR